MGIEVYKVPATWEHPKSDNEYIPLFDNFRQALFLWEQGKSDWAKGILNRTETIPTEFKDYSWEEFAEPRPDPQDYMPEWEESDLTHYQLYNTTDGVPISPIFDTEDELLDWLVNNQVEAFGKFGGDRVVALPLESYQLDYIREKFDCIYGELFKVKS